MIFYFHAAGIGVTPFSSILQSLWSQHSIKTCPNCNFKSIDKIGVQRLKMVIYWKLNYSIDATYFSHMRMCCIFNMISHN